MGEVVNFPFKGLVEAVSKPQSTHADHALTIQLTCEAAAQLREMAEWMVEHGVTEATPTRLARALIMDALDVFQEEKNNNQED